MANCRWQATILGDSDFSIVHPKANAIGLRSAGAFWAVSRRTAFGEQALKADIRSSAARRFAFDPQPRIFAAAAAVHDLE